MSQAKLNKRLRAASLMAGIASLSSPDQPMPCSAGGGRGRGCDPNGGATTIATTNAADPSKPRNGERTVCSQRCRRGRTAVCRRRAKRRPPASTPPPKTPQQKLAELQSLYDQKLISQSDYQAAKTKILNQLAN